MQSHTVRGQSKFVPEDEPPELGGVIYGRQGRSETMTIGH